MDALVEMQRRFYVDFGPHPEEAKYGEDIEEFVVGSTCMWRER